MENYLRLARHHAKLNNIEEAVDLYTSVLKVSKDNQEAIDFLSLYGKGSIMNSKHSGKKQSMQFHRF